MYVCVSIKENCSKGRKTQLLYLCHDCTLLLMDVLTVHDPSINNKMPHWAKFFTLDLETRQMTLMTQQQYAATYATQTAASGTRNAWVKQQHPTQTRTGAHVHMDTHSW